MAINTKVIDNVEKIVNAIKEYAQTESANNQRSSLYKFLNEKLGLNLKTDFPATGDQSKVAYTDPKEVISTIKSILEKM